MKVLSLSLKQIETHNYYDTSKYVPAAVTQWHTVANKITSYSVEQSILWLQLNWTYRVSIQLSMEALDPPAYRVGLAPYSFMNSSLAALTLFQVWIEQ